MSRLVSVIATQEKRPFLKPLTVIYVCIKSDDVLNNLTRKIIGLERMHPPCWCVSYDGKIATILKREQKMKQIFSLVLLVFYLVLLR